MIKTAIKDIYNDQKDDYRMRYDLLNNALKKEDIKAIEERGFLSIQDILQMNQHALGLEGDENNASFEVGMIRALQMLDVSMMAKVKKHIKKIKDNNGVSQDFILGMDEIYQLIRK